MRDATLAPVTNVKSRPRAVDHQLAHIGVALLRYAAKSGSFRQSGVVAAHAKEDRKATVAEIRYTRHRAEHSRHYDHAAPGIESIAPRQHSQFRTDLLDALVDRSMIGRQSGE